MVDAHTALFANLYQTAQTNGIAVLRGLKTLG